MSRKTHASAPSGGLRFTTGSYTGDGAATQAIVGVGFQPRWLIIYQQTNLVERQLNIKEQSDANSYWFSQSGGTARWNANQIISLDGDGFTVGNANGNQLNFLNADYTYIALG